MQMYIAMNTFRVVKDRCDDFEQAWRERESYLFDVSGFESFHLLKGPGEDDVAVYASHTTWKDEKSFLAWMNSESFRKAHSQGKLTGIIAGPPKFVGWTAVIGESCCS